MPIDDSIELQIDDPLALLDAARVDPERCLRSQAKPVTIEILRFLHPAVEEIVQPGDLVQDARTLQMPRYVRRDRMNGFHVATFPASA